MTGTYSILVDEAARAVATIDYNSATDVTATAPDWSLLSEDYINQYIADHAGINSEADVLAALGIQDVREDPL